MLSSKSWIVFFICSFISLLLVLLHPDFLLEIPTKTNTTTNQRRLTLRENIQQGLHFLHLDGQTQDKQLSSVLNSSPESKTKKDESDLISFLEPEKIQSQKPSILSQAISFLDLTVVKARERLHLEQLEKKKQQSQTFMPADSPQPPQPATTTTHTAKVKDTAKESESKKDHTIQFLTTEEVKTIPKQTKRKKEIPSKIIPKVEADSLININFGSGKKKKNPNTNQALSNVNIDTNLDGPESEIVESHPQISPRKGTDISPENYKALLHCPNQSKCIVPELQLAKKLKIYFCRHPVRYGVRFYFLSREGLLLHPNVELLTYDHIDDADFIIYLPGSAPWHKTECNVTSYAPKLIVLDEFDGHTLFLPTRTREEYISNYGSMSNPWYFLYFKRSYVRRTDGKFQGYPHLAQYENYPMVYAVAEAYIGHKFNEEREIEILCTLRGSIHMTTRLRVQTWVSEYGKERNIANVKSSQTDSASRTEVSLRYFEQMRHAKIIVTVNPANWEGDFRLWEAMCTGALIFVDPIFVPHPYPLIDGEHVVFFSNQNRSDLFHKLDYYRSHPDEARRIALNGYFHAMKYHRTINLIDYILRTAHTRQLTLAKQEAPDYLYTGQFLHYMTKLQEKMIKQCDTPGIYEPFRRINGTSYVRHLTSCPEK